MPFSKLIADRYAVRQFSDRAVPEDLLQTILEAGRLAPTARNLQPIHITIFQGAESLERLSGCSPCLYGAPVALMISYNDEISLRRDGDDMNFGPIDASIVATHMMLQAADLGLGTCFVGALDVLKFRSLFRIPDSRVPICLLPIGYPAEGCQPAEMHSQRKSLNELAEWL